MMSDAVAMIRLAEAHAAADRDRRLEARAALTRAEQLSREVEELLVRHLAAVPEELASEIRRFVADHDGSLLSRLGRPVATLDALMDLQEVLQSRRRGGGGPGVAVRAEARVA